MGLIPDGPLTVDTSEEEVVYALDPDVTPPPDLVGCGWIPAERCDVRKGADKLKCRILGSNELRVHRGIAGSLPERGGGELAGYHYALTTGVLEVNGKRKNIKSCGKTYPTISAYLDALMAANRKSGAGAAGAAGSVAYQLAALRVLARSNSKDMADYYATARIWLGVEGEEAEEVADAGASKSEPG